MTLFGDAEHEPVQENVVALANEVYSTDILLLLLQHLGKFDFEVSFSNKQIFLPYLINKAVQFTDEFRQRRTFAQSSTIFCEDRLVLDHQQLSTYVETTKFWIIFVKGKEKLLLIFRK